MKVSETSEALSAVAGRLMVDDLDGARRVAEDRLSFVPRRRESRALTVRRMTAVMIRDGFIDRYTDQVVWHPGALRLLSLLMPEHLPWHAHGKLESSHIIHWDLAPSIDHVVALTRGGSHCLDNWVTTSWANNLQKSNSSLEQTRWSLHPPGRVEEWDGYLGWFIAEVDRKPDLRKVAYLRRWHGAACAVLSERGINLDALPTYPPSTKD